MGANPTVSKPERDASERKKRMCLMCQKSFMSAWAGDRICKRCRHSPAWRHGRDATEPFNIQRGRK